jgi:hypothetical protein
VRRGEFLADLNDPHHGGGGILLLEGITHRLSRCGVPDILENLRNHAQKRTAEQMLLLVIPALVLRIGGIRRAGRRDNRLGLQRSSIGSIEEPEKLRTAKIWQELCTPKEIVCFCELDGDNLVDVNWWRGGQWRGGHGDVQEDRHREIDGGGDEAVEKIVEID